MDRRGLARRRDGKHRSSVASVESAHSRLGVSEPRQHPSLREAAYQIQISNRKLPLLEYGPSHRKQTTGARSNRQFLRLAAILFPRHAVLCFLCALCASAVSGFATKISVKTRDITRHTMPSNLVRNSMKTNNRCSNYSTHFCRVAVAPYFRPSETNRPRVSRPSRRSCALRRA